MTSITEPTITHPTWCDPAECASEVAGGALISVVHGTAPTTWASAEVGIESIEAEAYLVAIDHREDEFDQPAGIYTILGGHSLVSPDQLEALGRWLTERAAEYRRMIEIEAAAEAEGGAR